MHGLVHRTTATLAGLLLASAHGAAGLTVPTLDPAGARIEFETPADWRCTADAPCVTCRNVSDHDSAIVIVSPLDDARRRHAIAGGTTLQICSDTEAEQSA